MKTIILAQALISFMMALLMSGYATCLQFGFTMEWVHIWMRAFAMAWPVAFCLAGCRPGWFCPGAQDLAR